MRLSLIGVKGGIGKSTLAVSLSKLIMKMGKRVLLVDRDLIGWSSKLLGLEDSSLLHKASTGESGEFYRSENDGEGKLTVVRVNPDFPLFLKDYRAVKESNEKFRAFVDLYRPLLLEHEIFVVDNPPNIFQGDELTDLEHQAFSITRDEKDWYRIYVTDPSERGLSVVLDYMTVSESISSKGKAGGLIMNMVPPLPEELTKASSTMKKVCIEYKISLCGVIPFDERLYTYSSYAELKEFPEQVISLAKALVNLPASSFIE